MVSDMQGLPGQSGWGRRLDGRLLDEFTDGASKLPDYDYSCDGAHPGESGTQVKNGWMVMDDANRPRTDDGRHFPKQSLVHKLPCP